VELTGGSHLSARNEKEKKEKERGAESWVGSLAGPFCLGLAQLGWWLSLPFFFVLQLFLFSVFYFFHNFCKDASNQLKPLSGIF
jgi:hypothetical protein